MSMDPGPVGDPAIRLEVAVTQATVHISTDRWPQDLSQYTVHAMAKVAVTVLEAVAQQRDSNGRGFPRLAAQV